ncbi:hypothetical protein GOV10_04430, partial [Candidatus Woesearchaeota archaeon]|nr:hypothetical protein [Candidatus Woesearchaeota archaeon]
MKSFHHVTISVFLKPKEDTSFLDTLLPTPISSFLEQQFKYDPDHEQTKIYTLPKAQLRVQDAEGFSDTLAIMTFRFDRERDTNDVFDKIVEYIGKTGRAALRSEAMLHVDEEGRFYVRLDKLALREGKYVLTTSGDCVHCAFLIAAYPKNMKTIKNMVHTLL